MITEDESMVAAAFSRYMTAPDVAVLLLKVKWLMVNEPVSE